MGQNQRAAGGTCEVHAVCLPLVANSTCAGCWDAVSIGQCVGCGQRLALAGGAGA
ncbi:MAG: hypothetical protein IPH54_06645 [Rhodoferax sp.]|nr:hypothetical protein [Rhodoferax sp.]